MGAGGLVGNIATFTSGGFVGIGTTIPVGKLQVVSGITASSMTLGSTAGISQSLTYDTGGWGMYFGVDGSTGNGWIQQGRTSSATAYNLLLNPSGGNVGIGTTAPTALLDLEQLTGGAFSEIAHAYINNAVSGNGVIIKVGTAAATNGWIGYRYNGTAASSYLMFGMFEMFEMYP